MGSWSYDIMGGDNALDIKSNIFEICDIEEFPESGDAEIPKDIFLSNIDKITSEYKNCEEKEWLLVLGHMLMESNIEINDKLKKQICKAAKQDEWAEDDSERKKVIDKFILDIKKYKNI